MSLVFSLIQTVTDTDPVTLAGLLERYGPTGLGFVVLLTMILRQSKSSQKRIEVLEEAQQKQHLAHLESQKQMIADYVELVRNKTKVLSDLTGCLNAIKETLERMERQK